MTDKQTLLEDAKNSYIKYCESHESWQKSSKAFHSARKIERKLLAVQEAADSLEKSVRTLLTLSSQDSEEHKRFTKMLLHTLICKLEWMCEDCQPHDDCFLVFEEIMTLFEPTDDNLAKLFVRYIIGTNTRPDDTNWNSLEQHNFVFVKFLTALTESPEEWQGDDVFNVPFEEQSLRFLEYDEKHSMANVLTALSKNLQRRYDLFEKSSTDELQELPPYNLITKKLISDDFGQITDGIKMLSIRIQPLLSVGCLKQAHHLISLGLYYIQKLRNGLLEKNQSLLDNAEGDLIGKFASYASNLVHKWFGEKSGIESKNNDDFTELTEAIEDDLVIYSSEFPTECPKGEDEIERMIKKAIEWADRAIVFHKDFPEEIILHNSTKNMLNHFLNKLPLI